MSHAYNLAVMQDEVQWTRRWDRWWTAGGFPTWQLYPQLRLRLLLRFHGGYRRDDQ